MWALAVLTDILKCEAGVLLFGDLSIVLVRWLIVMVISGVVISMLSVRL